MKSNFRLKATPAPFLLAVMSVIVLTSCGGSTSSTATIPTPATNNSVAVTAGFGPLGLNGGLVNGLFTTITVCQHGTQNCAAIPNVLVDTGSIGVRLVPSAIGSLLTPITESGNALEECVQYGDTSYSWGPMAFADLDIAGEMASNIAVQLLGQTNFALPGNCLTTPVDPNLPNGGDEDSLQTLGANGILGIGNGAVDGPWDCGSYCTTQTLGNPYYICPNSVCSQALVSTGAQAANPVAFFTSSDGDGVMITLPSVSTTGAITVAGTMTFGINTQTDNSLGSATLYSTDGCGFIPTIIYNGVSYVDSLCATGSGGFGGLLDTGSDALYVSDNSTLSFLGISDCLSGTSGFGFYCVSGARTATLSNIEVIGNGVGSGFVALNVGDGTTLINSNNGVFNNLGGESGGTGPSTDSFDFGLPFFLGRTVSIGITGVSGTTSGTFALTAPNGFVAF